ncbi:MAG: PmoA family protein, partial [Bacteroidales bacterium]|nr:PmoA family protein [Bacteroidales bacterium]
MECPVSVNLDQLNYNEDQGSLVLVEVVGEEEMQVPCQLESGHSARLWFILAGETPGGTNREFILRLQDADSNPVKVELLKRQGQLRLSKSDHPILDYQFKTVYPPEGINNLFRRSGFIHPLWSPDGQVLSRIQPPDHYHHYGIWGPYTRTRLEEHNTDFWNLGEKQGTVRFANYESRIAGPVYGEISVLQEHVDFQAENGEKVVMIEKLTMRVWKLPEPD